MGDRAVLGVEEICQLLITDIPEESPVPIVCVWILMDWGATKWTNIVFGICSANNLSQPKIIVFNIFERTLANI